ncbi:hypothetical protein B0H11DRAFT_2223393 [Mycena galericulata]|nr:hypothetical protein B0H11DRAFT_2223393 [Mycena galericulata]
MDEHYDFAAAGRFCSTHRLAAEKQNDCADRPLERLEVDDIIIHDADGRTKEWRLCKFDGEGDEYIELLTRIQGILVKSNLIPSADTLTRIASNKIIYLSQSAVIAGYGSTSFSRSIRSTEEIYSLFARHLPPGTMMEWKPPLMADYEIFSASTRLFTKTPYEAAETDLPFGEGVDTTQGLEQMKTSHLLHLADNQVAYLKRVVDKTTKKSNYEETTPAIFRVGDIVEMEVYFIAFRRHDKRVKMVTRLQGLTLLDSTFSKEAATKRRDAKRIRVAKPTLKRKLSTLYDEDSDDGHMSEEEVHRM